MKLKARLAFLVELCSYVKISSPPGLKSPAKNMCSEIFIAAPDNRFQVQRVDIDRDIYNFCHRLNHAIREEIKIDLGAPG